MKDSSLASPLKSAWYGIIFWLILYVIAPINYVYPISLTAILLFTFSYFTFFLGYFIGINVKSLNYSLSIPVQKNKLYYFFLFISFVSVLLIFVDKFMLRGVSVSAGAFENREILKRFSPTIIGVIGNVLKASVFMSLFLYYQFNIKHRTLVLINYGFIIYFIFENFLTGSRSVPVFYVILTLLILLHFRKIKIRLKYLIPLIILGLWFFVVLTEVFISRSMEFSGTREKAIEFILMKASYLDYTVINKDYLRFVLSIESFYLQSFFVGLGTVYVYYLHSLVEYSYLIDHFDSNARLGSHTFYIITKFFNIMTGMYDGKESNYIPRPGKYTTFFGDIYMDFKYFSLVFMLLFGFWQARLYKSVLVQGNFTIIPLILFLCVLNFIFPVFNLISGGTGIYLIIGFIILSYLYKFISNAKLN